MPDKNITDAVEAGVDRALSKLASDKKSWIKTIVIAIGLVAVGFIIGQYVHG